ncbi:hypothetical protein [Massilia sp. TWR1-2-2]|uniref:hypothetical protein n=1 Tax=Massilia sp. TWR1-2-2 TaxID=2804584 RepID=UPI003CEE61B8
MLGTGHCEIGAADVGARGIGLDGIRAGGRQYLLGQVKVKAALSPAAVRGLALFRHDAQCVACHSIGTTPALFADDKFHSLGMGLRRLTPELAPDHAAPGKREPAWRQR